RKADFPFRYFLLPSNHLNLEANAYWEMVAVSKHRELFWEPPIVKKVADLRKFQIPKLPCHTQAVESAVKDTSMQAQRVCSQEKRNLDLLVTVESRDVRKRSH